MKVLNFLLAILLALSTAALVAVVRERKKAAHQSPVGQLEAMRDVMDVMDRASKVARDPTESGVTAVFVAGQMLKQKSPGEAIEFWNKTLPEAQNDSVRRAIHAQLVELYRKDGKPELAMEQLRMLITSAPAGGTQTAATR